LEPRIIDDVRKALDAAAAHEKKKDEASVNTLFEELVEKVERYDNSYLTCGVRLLNGPLFTDKLIFAIPKGSRH
jgi:hypothetical protein